MLSNTDIAEGTIKRLQEERMLGSIGGATVATKAIRNALVRDTGNTERGGSPL